MEIRNLKRLKTLMAIHGVSTRELSRIAGYKSHTHMARILRGDYKSLEPARALAIVAYFQVGTDDLFIVRASNQTEGNERSNAA